MKWRIDSAIVLAAIVAGLGCAAPAENAAPEPSNSTPQPQQPTESSVAPGPIGLGEGFLVWESNRTGRWRLWTRDLAGGEPRQLTPEEGRRLHCCPHISPDGEQIVYLSLPPDQDGYPQGGAIGRMMVIDPGGSSPRMLVENARNYYENRAAVWISPTQLNYIAEDGRAAQFDLATGESQWLTEAASETGPWLINSNLTWAASGQGAFAPFDRDRGRVAERGPRPGCQPYFSHDGLWGFWVVAPGGPIHRLHLESGTDSTLLRKSDPLLPADRGYLYFPMLSADSRLLAFGASDNAHEHFSADYDIFIAETDPRTLELLGKPIRFTHHPATDRFPDVFRAPLPLGRQQGEAPYHWLPAPDLPDHDWQWSFGDGTTAQGTRVEHLYQHPGRFEVVASASGIELRGQVIVDLPAPPRVLSSSLQRHSTVIRVVFDEAIDIAGLEATLDSGLGITGAELERDDRRLHLSLAEPLSGDATLTLTGITDRAQSPNALSPVELKLGAPTWPARHADLTFLWQTGDAMNLLFDPEVEAETAVTLTPRGLARFDRFFRMVPAGGRFEASEAASRRVVLDSKKTYEISIELTLEAERAPPRRDAVILTSAASSRRNFALEQQGSQLFLTLRMKSRGEGALPRVRLLELPAERPAHLVVTYAPGSLKTYLDGRLVHSDSSVDGGFFHWRAAPLLFGSDWNGKRPWRGNLEGIALYSRTLEEEEVRESFLRYREQLENRPPGSTWRVRARETACSAAPTLEQIDPYREALVVCRYEVSRTLVGQALPPTIRVARWSMLDGQQIRSNAAAADSPRALDLGLLAENPQLESVFLADTLKSREEGPLFFLQTP